MMDAAPQYRHEEELRRRAAEAGARRQLDVEADTAHRRGVRQERDGPRAQRYRNQYMRRVQLL